MSVKKTIILASQSRDRKRLLTNAGIPHIVIVSDYRENMQSGMSSKQLSLYHAKGKANSVNSMVKEKPNLIPTNHYIIIAADTVVDFQGEILGKAKNPDHAKEMLKKLMGKAHKLITGVVIFDSESENTSECVDCTTVRFSPLSVQEISDYIMNSEEYKWRAGCYSMFDRASVFIESITGSPSNVIGLPMDFIYKELKKLGLNILKVKEK